MSSNPALVAIRARLDRTSPSRASVGKNESANRYSPFAFRCQAPEVNPLTTYDEPGSEPLEKRLLQSAWTVSREPFTCGVWHREVNPLVRLHPNLRGQFGVCPTLPPDALGRVRRTGARQRDQLCAHLVAVRQRPPRLGPVTQPVQAVALITGALSTDGLGRPSHLLGDHVGRPALRGHQHDASTIGQTPLDCLSVGPLLKHRPILRCDLDAFGVRCHLRLHRRRTHTTRQFARRHEVVP